MRLRPWLDQLTTDGLLFATGVDGVYLRSARFAAVVDALDGMVGRAGAADAPEVFRFPPAMHRTRWSGAATSRAFRSCSARSTASAGDEAGTPGPAALRRCRRGAFRRGMTGQQAATDLRADPRGCYPLYRSSPPVTRCCRPKAPLRACTPGASATSRPAIRHASKLPGAGVSCRMGREGAGAGVPPAWFDRAQDSPALALPHTIDIANDPFFGRSGASWPTASGAEAEYELLVRSTAKPGPPHASASIST